MTQIELEALLGGAVEPDPDLALIIAVGRLGRDRAWARTLAAEVLASDDLVEDLPPALPLSLGGPLRLAATSAGASLPAIYEGGGARLLLTVDRSGRVVARLEAGPPELTLEAAEPHLQLRPGEDVLVPWMDDAPGQLSARAPSGVLITLTRTR